MTTDEEMPFGWWGSGGGKASVHPKACNRSGNGSLTHVEDGDTVHPLAHESRNGAMSNYIDGILSRQKQLEDDRRFCEKNRLVADFKDWSLQRLITLSPFMDEMADETKEALRIARQRAETIDSPAYRSAAIAADALAISAKALAVNEKTAENAVKQRYVTMAAVVVSLLSLLATVFWPRQERELSKEQLQALRAEVISELAVMEPQLSQPSRTGPEAQSEPNPNPFLPRR